jgi:hypothetical protein
MAAPPRPAKVSGLGSAAGPTPIEVRDAALVIDCSRGPDACRLEVTYQLHNTGSAPAGGSAAFYASDTEGVSVTVDGKPADHPLTGGDADAFDASFAGGSDGRLIL